METILIDFPNEHGHTLKEMFLLMDLSFSCDFIQKLEEIPDIIDKHKQAIYCIPIA